MFVFCLPISVCFYVLMNQSNRNIQDSGLKLLANLKLKEIVSKKDSMVSVSNFGLTKFFENLFTLKVVDLSGASCLNVPAIEALANNNKNLNVLILDTYLLPGRIVSYVIERCNIQKLVFTPSVVINRSNVKQL